ncbi:MAG: glutamine synthetase family protein, partial [bacterium]
APADLGENVRREIIQNLQEMGFQITSSHHEMAPAQHEIDFVGDRPDRAADQILTYKMAVKTVAKKHGLHATFMPKPVSGQYGSGMHIILKAFDSEGGDAFADPAARDGMSEQGRCFLAGILEHISGMSLVTNPLVNSYKRLVRGYDAPVDIGWSSRRSNRSALIHMGSRKGRMRLELRNPDCTCNPYLTLALCIAAGMDGIEKGLSLPEETELNLFKLSSRQLTEMNIDRLPRTMGEAIVAYEEDDFIRETLGREAWFSYLKAKRREWKEYRSMVSQWELDQYLSMY